MDPPAGGRGGDPGEFRSVHAIRDAVPTRRHAEMLFDLLADLLGEEAWIETADHRTRRSLFRREAPGSKAILPWPLLTLGLGGRLATVIPPSPPPPDPGGTPPRLRGLGPGEVMVHDGPESVSKNRRGLPDDSCSCALATTARVDLHRFGGHLPAWENGVHHVQVEAAVLAGVPATDPRSGEGGAHPGGVGPGVRTDGHHDPQLDEAGRHRLRPSG